MKYELASPKLTRGKCKHTPQPTGYVEWFEWAKNKIKTHKQERCPNCGKFDIWVKKGKNNAQ